MDEEKKEDLSTHQVGVRPNSASDQNEIYQSFKSQNDEKVHSSIKQKKYKSANKSKLSVDFIVRFANQLKVADYPDLKSAQ